MWFRNCVNRIGGWRSLRVSQLNGRTSISTLPLLEVCRRPESLLPASFPVVSYHRLPVLRQRYSEPCRLIDSTRVKLTIVGRTSGGLAQRTVGPSRAATLRFGSVGRVPGPVPMLEHLNLFELPTAVPLPALSARVRLQISLSPSP